MILVKKKEIYRRLTSLKKSETWLCYSWNTRGYRRDSCITVFEFQLCYKEHCLQCVPVLCGFVWQAPDMCYTLLIMAWALVWLQAFGLNLITHDKETKNNWHTTFIASFNTTDKAVVVITTMLIWKCSFAHISTVWSLIVRWWPDKKKTNIIP